MNTTRFDQLEQHDDPVSSGEWVQAVTPNQARRPLSRWENVKIALGTVALLGSAIGVGVVAAEHAFNHDSLPEPTKTGEVVAVYPSSGEGEGTLMSDLARPGVNPNELKAVVKASEVNEGLTGQPIDVDSGLLTTNQQTLHEYQVTPQQ